MIIYTDEMRKISNRVRPYKLRDGLSWHWADNTPQSIKDDWQKFSDWYDEVYDSHAAVGTKV